MTSAALRQRLWAVAGRLDDLETSGLLPARWREWEASPSAAVAYQDIATAPDWLAATTTEFRRKAWLVGAVAAAAEWRNSLDGAALRQIASELGEELFEKLAGLPSDALPAGGLCPTLPVRDLEAVGASVLAATLPRSSPLRARLERLFPAAAAMDDVQARLTLKTADEALPEEGLA